jgi:hypothetical protein
MSIKGDLQAFSRGDIDKAPDEPGVYALYQGGRLIYIGRAEGGPRRSPDLHRARRGRSQYHNHTCAPKRPLRGTPWTVHRTSDPLPL